MGQWLLYRAGVITFNLIYSLLTCAFFWRVFIYYRCYKHELQTRIINNALNGILQAPPSRPSFYSQPPVWQAPLFTGLWMSVGLKNKSFSVLRYISVWRQPLIWRELKDTGMSSCFPKVLLSGRFLEGTFHWFFELVIPFADMNSLGKSVMRYCSPRYTTWYKFMLLVISYPISWKQPPKGKLIWWRKRGMFWNIDHGPMGCIWEWHFKKICRVRRR